MKERQTYDEAYRLFSSINVDPRYRNRGNGMTAGERELLLLIADAVVLAWADEKLANKRMNRLAELADDLLQLHGLGGYSKDA
jgi:hypothetical protein